MRLKLSKKLLISGTKDTPTTCVSVIHFQKEDTILHRCTRCSGRAVFANPGEPCRVLDSRGEPWSAALEWPATVNVLQHYKDEGENAWGKDRRGDGEVITIFFVHSMYYIVQMIWDVIYHQLFLQRHGSSGLRTESSWHKISEVKEKDSAELTVALGSEEASNLITSQSSDNRWVDGYLHDERLRPPFGFDQSGQ